MNSLQETTKSMRSKTLVDKGKVVIRSREHQGYAADCTPKMVQWRTSVLCHRNFDRIRTMRLIISMLSRVL
jgi:hypothetical protein